jgi:transcriptional regulator with XRE-family HTH domain
MLIDGRKLKKLRDGGGAKLVDVAQVADMSVPWVSGLETKPRHEVNRHVAAALAKFFGVPLKEIEAKPEEKPVQEEGSNVR